MKLLLKPITARKITNFQNTVRRLKIILPSLLFLLIIRASIRRPYGKNLADPRYDQKDDQFAKYCHTLLRIHRVIWCLLSNRHFKTLTLKFLLNGITKETMTNLQNTVKRHGISFSGSILLPIITVTFWRSYCEIRAKPHRGLKKGQFPKHCLTVKFLLNQKYES